MPHDQGGLPTGGSASKGVCILGCLYPGGSASREVYIQEVGVCIQGKRGGGLHPGGLHSEEVCIQGGLDRKVGGAHPTGMLSCYYCVLLIFASRNVKMKNSREIRITASKNYIQILC